MIMAWEKSVCKSMVDMITVSAASYFGNNSPVA